MSDNEVEYLEAFDCGIDVVVEILKQGWILIKQESIRVSLFKEPTHLTKYKFKRVKK